MMKSVLIAIRPQLVEKIASGEKTIEVRKTAPKEVPFKAYIYCCKAKPYLYKEANPPFELFLDSELYKGNGYDDRLFSDRVIGEFICDKVEIVNAKCSDYGIDLFYHDCLTNGCLTEREIEKYFNVPEDRDLRAMKGNGYVWNISDLKIYDKPKELSEFRKPCDRFLDCCTCRRLVRNEYMSCDNKINRPPLSWCYVEELGEEE